MDVVDVTVTGNDTRREFTKYSLHKGTPEVYFRCQNKQLTAAYRSSIKCKCNRTVGTYNRTQSL